MTDNGDGTEDKDEGRPPSRADSIRLPAVPPRPRKWPVGPADEFPSFGAETRQINADPLLDSTTQAQTVGPPRNKGRRKLLTGLAALLVALVAAGVVIWQWPSGGTGPIQEAAATTGDAAPASPGPGTVGETTGTAGSPVKAPGDRSTTGGSPSASATTSAPATATSSPAGSTPSATAPTKAAVTGKSNPSGADLALNGTATASSIEPGTDWTAGMAADGDSVNSRWSSAYSDPQWWQVDLKQAYQLTTVTLVWERAHATSYRVEASTDGSAWKTIYSTTAGLEGTTSVSAKGTVARYVRVTGTKRFNQYGYSLYEVIVK
ncbi:discoidin domain-containing protein [Actinoplanes sp. TBRC 11911]|uniref:discoidin domain-containing protein n=1 Tax=Actinoplanes sp. TBRC 11911 TaxID=2729386 RepID=UPI00145FC001|nr:discoidin domain-containing protein [Actinoplanes sp. TBRC 11911]NMO56165.1 discoidin domain-containing protein [Actinoplanes sp. TBRC 11911]